jgi:ComF family protein
MAQLVKDSGLLEELAKPDYIIPVPLHPRRLRQRGFNQSLLLARAIFAQRADCILPHLLQRNRWTGSQTGRSGKDRRKNLTGAISLAQAGSVQDATLLVIDDVFTTGTTVNECAKVLKKAGAGQVEVLTLVRSC